jgi:DNA-binding NarL/FixJ family response regulator
MEIKKSKGIYLTLGRNEILIHVPFRAVFEEVAPVSNERRVKLTSLTKREEQVLKCLMQNKANKEIGADLHLSERTVKFHVSSLLAKHKVGSRIDLYGIYANASGERQ